MQQSNCLVATKLLPLETVAFLASFLVGGLSDKSDGSDESDCGFLKKVVRPWLRSAGGSVESDIFGSFAVRVGVGNIDYLENKFWVLA